MSVKLSFFTGGGVDGIGGNKILLESDRTALFLDFGKSFGEENKYFDEFLKPRSLNGLGDLLAFDLIPPLPGIYREDLQIPNQKWWGKASSHPAFRKLTIQGVLLSHAHLDHSGYISLLSPDIPIYTSLFSALIAKAIQDCGISDFLSEIVYAKPKEFLENGLICSDKNYSNPSQQRPYYVFTNQLPSEQVEHFWNQVPGKRPLSTVALSPVLDGIVNLGDLPIRFWPVDHSIPGAGAFGIYTPEGWVLYSGDLRMSGKKAKETQSFTKDAASLQPLLLIIEGTRASLKGGHGTKHFTEQDVADRISQIIKKAKGLVIADFGPRNLERLISVLKATEEVNRQLVITTRDAYLLEALSQCGEVDLPNLLGHSHIRIYTEKRIRTSEWESTLLERCRAQCLNAEEVSIHPDEFVFCFSYYDFNELIDINPSGGAYIYSATEAFNEEMQLDAVKLKNWIDHFHFQLFGNPFVQKNTDSHDPLHVGGHARPDELLNIIETIHPNYLLPVHTECFEFFENHFGTRKDIKLIRPQAGESVAL
jgi:ribonuclease J